MTAPAKGKPTEIDITNEIRTACESLIPVVTESMMELIARVEPEYQAQVRNNVILCGGSGLIRGIGPALEGALDEFGGGKIRVVEDPVFIGSDGGLAIAQDAVEQRQC